MDLPAERALVADTCRALAADGLVEGTAGNVSARAGDLVAVSPTGAALAVLEAGDVAVVDLAGEQVAGPLAPTSELGLHLAIHAERGEGAVVHTHAPMATALSCVLDELPVVHYEQLALGGAVRVAPYATFATPELAAAAQAALEGKAAALLANHGTIAHGPDCASALRVTRLLEWVATVYWRAAQLGPPRTLTDEQLADVVRVAVERAYGTTKEAR